MFSLLVLVAGMVTIGIWIEREIRQAVTNRTAGVTALYASSFILPHVQSLTGGADLDAAAVETLDRVMSDTPLGRDIVAFKIWAADGSILYSPDETLIGRSFGARSDLVEAFTGEVVSHISDLSGPENFNERQFWDSLIETYAPLRLEGSGRVVAVAEFYQEPDALMADIRNARLRSWLIVGAATIVMYLLLVGLVRRASNVIDSQRDELEGTVDRLSSLLARNRRLQDRMREAAERTTALNERYLHRISADLHDGPAQDVSLALLRMEHVPNGSVDDPKMDGRSADSDDLSTVRSALESALTDLRAIARGLLLPEIEDIAPADTARRVIRDFQRVTGTNVDFSHEGVPETASLPVKITIYRVLQEALANGFKHASGATQIVTMSASGDELCLEIADDGPGFDAAAAVGDGALGVAGMRERVEMLGGRFDVARVDPTGTRIHACLPLTLQEAIDG